MHMMNVTGAITLLMNNVQGADPDYPLNKEISRLNALKGRITDEQRAERDYLKWRSALYWDEEDGPVLPSANIFKSILQAAALTRNGKDVERGMVIHSLHSPLAYDGPRSIEGLWNGGKGSHVDRRMATVNRAPVPNLRPAFPNWSASFEFDLDEEILSLDDFVWIAEKAGRLIHVGDYRRFYGAYRVTVE
ncbi:MAG TPA: hypothetical protein VI248_20340 [Kineosporiaceae bacterium]